MKKILLSSLVIVLVFVFLSTSINAQPLSTEQIRTQMVDDWQRAKAYTMEYLNTMPADKYGFLPVDTVKRSFAQQMLHLSGGNVFLMATATNAKPPEHFGFDLEQRPGAQSKDSVMYYVTTSYDFCISSVQSSDMSKWGEPVEIFGFKTTRFGLMNKTFEHQTHHRGQTTIYIRLQGIKPPQEKLF